MRALVYMIAKQIAPGIRPQDSRAVMVIFTSDNWVDNEDGWPWQLAPPEMSAAPYYWGVNA